jgi:hypothetical protein
VEEGSIRWFDLFCDLSSLASALVHNKRTIKAPPVQPRLGPGALVSPFPV